MQFKVNFFNQKNFHKNMVNRYKPVLILMFIVGFNFKVFKFFNRFRILSVFYSISLIIVMSLSAVYCSENFNYLQIGSLLEYIFSIFILIIYNSKLNEFSAKLCNIDTFLRINFKCYYKSKMTLFFTIFILWVIRICYTTIYCMCFTCYTILILYLISLIALLALDMNRVWRFLLLDIVRNRLSLLRKRVEETSRVNYYLYATNNKTLKEDKIIFFTNLYRNIIDIADLISPEIHASVSIKYLIVLYSSIG